MASVDPHGPVGRLGGRRIGAEWAITASGVVIVLARQLRKRRQNSTLKFATNTDADNTDADRDDFGAISQPEQAGTDSWGEQLNLTWEKLKFAAEEQFQHLLRGAHTFGFSLTGANAGIPSLGFATADSGNVAPESFYGKPAATAADPIPTRRPARTHRPIPGLIPAKGLTKMTCGRTRIDKQVSRPGVAIRRHVPVPNPGVSISAVTEGDGVRAAKTTRDVVIPATAIERAARFNALR